MQSLPASLPVSTSVSSRPFLFRPRSLFWPLQIGGWFAYFVLHFLTAMGDGKSLDYVLASLLVALCGFAITCVLRLGYRRLWGKPPLVMLGLAALMLVAAAVIHMKLSVTITFRYCDNCTIRNLLGYMWYFGTSLYLLLAWSGLYFGITLAQQLQRQKEVALRTANVAHAAQLRMLRYQLNPHFLFNTLNAIATLVLDDRRDTAYRMICDLSSFLRHSLESDPEQAVTLAQEVEVLNLYLDIERLRFGERLSFVVDIAPDAGDALVPSLILQPLVENAIKYAIAANEDGGHIVLVARREGDMLELHLRDDGPGIAAAPPAAGTGVGLANTRERLRVIYGDRYQLSLSNREPRGVDVRLCLPFSTVAVS